MQDAFPKALAELADLDIYGISDDAIDYEPYPDFMSPEDTTDWIRAWTGNDDLTGENFLVIGQDGSGGYAAFWLVNEDADLEEQPIVFFGSEGEAGVVASSLSDFLWLLAQGVGPMEAVEYGDESDTEEIAELVELAETFATGDRMDPEDILATARAEYPAFEDLVGEMVQQ